MGRRARRTRPPSRSKFPRFLVNANSGPPDESPAPARNAQRRAKRGPRGTAGGAKCRCRAHRSDTAVRIGAPGCAFRRGAAPATTGEGAKLRQRLQVTHPATRAKYDAAEWSGASQRRAVRTRFQRRRDSASAARGVAISHGVPPAVVPRAKLRRRETPPRETFRASRRNSSPQFRALAGAITCVAEFRAVRRNSRAKLALKKREIRCLARNHFSEPMFDYCLCCPA